jgi:hypothetical protein
VTGSMPAAMRREAAAWRRSWNVSEAGRPARSLTPSRTQIERFGDFAAVAFLRDKAQYFEFARTELVESGGGGGGGPLFGLRDVCLGEAFGNARCEQRFACVDETDR